MAAVAPRAGQVLLETVELEKTFGGLEAVRPVSFRLLAGEIRAIIGPNGAGKTTLVSMISGRIAPTSGLIIFAGRDITRVPAHARVTGGIVYTFQVTSIYRALSVAENVAIPAQRRLLRTLTPWSRTDAPALAARVDDSLERMGLGDAKDRVAGELPHGHQRLLEVAMAMALDPKLLILDEPTQGLAPEEITSLVRVLRRLAERVTILIIEHNMRVVLELSHRVTVMDRGAILAEGTPREIETHPDVQRVYLGR